MSKQDLYDCIGVIILYLRDSWRTKLVGLALYVVLLTGSLISGDGTAFIVVLPIIIVLMLIPVDIFRKE